jgi:DNA repair protein RecO
VFIQSCDLIEVFKDLTKSLEKIACASYILEITDELTREREENRWLFDHLRQGLSFIEKQEVSIPFLIYFELKLLGLSGYQPVLERCCRCRREWKLGCGGSWCFSYRDGGILCAPCSAHRKETLPVSQDTIAALLGLLQKGPFILASLCVPPSVLKQARLILPHFIQYQIHKELKTIRFLDTCLPV